MNCRCSCACIMQSLANTPRRIGNFAVTTFTAINNRIFNPIVELLADRIEAVLMNDAAFNTIDDGLKRIGDGIDRVNTGVRDALDHPLANGVKTGLEGLVDTARDIATLSNRYPSLPTYRGLDGLDPHPSDERFYNIHEVLKEPFYRAPTIR